VGKGSRQNRSVTLGKGLALRVGLVGLRLEARDPDREALTGSLFGDPFGGSRR
jgi:hypothetical protein